jgi:hypothetical protein
VDLRPPTRNGALEENFVDPRRSFDSSNRQAAWQVYRGSAVP